MTLSPDFDADFNLYTAAVPDGGLSETTVSAEPEHSGDSVSTSLDGAADADNVLPLVGDGPFVIRVEVTADPDSDRNDHVYEVVVSSSVGPRVINFDIVIDDPTMETVVMVRTEGLSGITGLVYDARVYRRNTLDPVSTCEGAGFGHNIPLADPSSFDLTIPAGCSPGTHTLDIRIYSTQTSGQAMFARDAGAASEPDLPFWERVVLRIVEIFAGDSDAEVQAQDVTSRELLAHGAIDMAVHEPLEIVVPTVDVSKARILRIEPSISGVTIDPRDAVRLSIDVYGRQDILENELADGATIVWRDSSVDGRFSYEGVGEGMGREVLYSGPSSIGDYTVTAAIADPTECFGDDEQCSARFVIRVRPPLHVETPDDSPPVNPAGAIPAVLMDSEGEQHEVFTPVDGGRFEGGDFSFEAPPGAVRDREIIGVSMRRDGPATTLGRTHHRYVLAGDWYMIAAIDAEGDPVESYRLGDAAQTCFPMPVEVRANITDVAVVAVHGEGSQTILSTRLRVTADGTVLCAALSELPARVAAARLGVPGEYVATSDPSLGSLDTGGDAPSAQALLFILMLGTAALIASFALAFGAKLRRRSPAAAGDD